MSQQTLLSKFYVKTLPDDQPPYQVDDGVYRRFDQRNNLTVGRPNDLYEQEADRVADQVMRMPGLGLRREPNGSRHSLSRRDKELEDELAQTRPLATEITPLVQRQSEESEEDDQELATKPPEHIKECRATEDWRSIREAHEKALQAIRRTARVLRLRPRPRVVEGELEHYFGDAGPNNAEKIANHLDTIYSGLTEAEF